MFSLKNFHVFSPISNIYFFSSSFSLSNLFSSLFSLLIFHIIIGDKIHNKEIVNIKILTTLVLYINKIVNPKTPAITFIAIDL